MKYIHPYKKVVSWDKFWQDCDKRKLSKLCSIIHGDKDKSCFLNDATKQKCPLWNKLDDLIVFKGNNPSSNSNNNNVNKYPVKRRSRGNYGKTKKPVSSVEKGLFED